MGVVVSRASFKGAKGGVLHRSACYRKDLKMVFSTLLMWVLHQDTPEIPWNLFTITHKT